MSEIVNTEEELDALPVGSVVLSSTYRHDGNGMQISFQRWTDGNWHRGGRSSNTHPDFFLPATVLHKAIEPARQAYIVECPDLGPGDQVWFSSWFEAERVCGPFPSCCVPKPVGDDYDGPKWVPE